jgi:hypothetical protein
MHAVRTHEPFLGGDKEERAVRDARLGRRCARVALPGVEVCIEMDDGDGPVDFVEGAEDGKNDGVVTAEAIICR